MSILSRIRKKRNRDFLSRLKYNNGADRKIGIYTIIDIHEIPPKIEKGDEFDFWYSNEKEIFILKIRNSSNEKYFISKSSGREAIMYLIAEIDFKQLNNNVIKKVLDKFNRRGIPKYGLNKISSIKKKTDE